MSQVITIKRTITHGELEQALSTEPDLRIAETHAWGLRLEWASQPEAHLVLVDGEIQATSPSDALYHRLEHVAETLDAQLIHEDDGAFADAPVQGGNVTSFSLFWPAVCALLALLLIWRW